MSIKEAIDKIYSPFSILDIKYYNNLEVTDNSAYELQYPINDNGIEYAPRNIGMECEKINPLFELTR